MTGDDPRLRFRLWVDAALANECWIDATATDAKQQADAVGQRQYAQAMRADAAGSRWLIEIFDPGKPADQAYVRFGTDRGGMVDPTPVDDLGAVNARGSHTERG